MGRLYIPKYRKIEKYEWEENLGWWKEEYDLVGIV